MKKFLKIKIKRNPGKLGSRAQDLNQDSNLPCLQVEIKGWGGKEDESKAENKRESLPNALGDQEECWRPIRDL